MAASTWLPSSTSTSAGVVSAMARGQAVVEADAAEPAQPAAGADQVKRA